jgi:hypothetical protein
MAAAATFTVPTTVWAEPRAPPQFGPDYHAIEAWRGLDAPVPACTPQMVARHTQLVGKLPWVMPTASADKRMVLGWTPGWSKFQIAWRADGAWLGLNRQIVRLPKNSVRIYVQVYIYRFGYQVVFGQCP